MVVGSHHFRKPPVGSFVTTHFSKKICANRQIGSGLPKNRGENRYQVGVKRNKSLSCRHLFTALKECSLKGNFLWVWLGVSKRKQNKYQVIMHDTHMYIYIYNISMYIYNISVYIYIYIHTYIYTNIYIYVCDDLYLYTGSNPSFGGFKILRETHLSCSHGTNCFR